MNRNRFKLMGVLLVLVLTMLPMGATYASQTSRPVQQEVGTNLLVNPGFEGIGRSIDNGSPNYSNWTRDTFTGVPYGEIFTPQGWVTWWQEGDFKRPECKVIPNEAPFNVEPYRVYDGYYSGMCFTFFGKQNAGYYQVVQNLSPGALVEGSFYAHAWACGEDSNGAKSCGEPYSFYFQVGIDPNGGTDPFSGNIVWSAPAYHYDEFGYVGPVQATVGGSGVVTFFMRAYGKWQLKHNDAYWDNASLVLKTQGEAPTATPPPPPPTSEVAEVPSAPQYTPTPLPDGTIVHIVESGDTLFGIAITYGVDLDELRRLNAGTLGPNDLLSIGQEIVISGKAAAVNPTATPVAAAETPAVTQEPAASGTQQPGGEATPSSTGGEIPGAPQAGTASLCVLAFNDRSNDMFRQADTEELLPNAQLNLVGTGGPAGNYTTNGMSEPYCFQDLQPGTYILRHTAPEGYKMTDGGQWNVPLNAGQVTNIELGYVRDENASSQLQTPTTGGNKPTDEKNTETPSGEEEEKSGGVTNVLNTIIRVSGIIVLVLTILVGVLFFLSRRAG
ncbi:MAG: LysM peptidoglycan-binding domain-containing protein [Anaerolineae bacterium]|nr:LysM peptidoglycan-binding domain-containing protein [Anaerolineae bacterium]